LSIYQRFQAGIKYHIEIGDHFTTFSRFCEDIGLSQFNKKVKDEWDIFLSRREPHHIDGNVVYIGN
jgi:hypothetical protein